MTEYRIKAEKWNGHRWVPCRVIVDVVFVANIKQGKKGEIMSIEETR